MTESEQYTAAIEQKLAICEEALASVIEALKKLQARLDRVEAERDALLRRFFGPKSEKVNPNQPTLFDLGEPDQPEAKPVDEEPTPVKPRKGHGRRKLPKELPRKEVVYDLPDEDKKCPCCGELRHKIDDVRSEQLEYEPAVLHVIEHVRLVYACRRCKSQVVTAAGPTKPIEKGLPGPGLLAHVVTSKTADHLPLNRQENMLKRAGVHLRRSTLCDWMSAVAEMLAPLVAATHEQILQSAVLQTDETGVPVLTKEQSRQTKTGRLWVYRGDDEHPYDVFDYTPDRSRAGPEAFVNGYKGYLQADACNVYDGLFTSGAIVEVGCWAHARRHVFAAKDTAVEASHELIARIRLLYAVEREAKDIIADRELVGEAAHGLRRDLRQQKSRLILDALFARVNELERAVLPKSPMGQALGYLRRQQIALCRYVEEGFLNIDNNPSERALRQVVIGRKNWLFAGSEAGARRAAILYTIVSSCRRHSIDPFVYLRDVITRLTSSNPPPLEILLPNIWRPTE